MMENEYYGLGENILQLTLNVVNGGAVTQSSHRELRLPEGGTIENRNGIR